MATSIQTVVETLRTTLQSAPLSLREVGWHGDRPGAGELMRDGVLYDLDFSAEGQLEGWSGGTVEVSQTIGVELLVPVVHWETARVMETRLSDTAEDVRRVVHHRSGLEVETLPTLEIDVAMGGQALRARVRFSVRYQLAVSSTAA